MLHGCPVRSLSAKMCSDSLCNLTSVEYVPVELIVNALCCVPRHSQFDLVVQLSNIAHFPYI